MSELRGDTPSYDEKGFGQPFSARIDSAIRFLPNHHILEAVGELLNDEGKEALAVRGLFLYSRTMRFHSLHEAQEFKSRIISPKINHTSASLARVSLTTFSTWENVQTPRGESFRVYMRPTKSSADALEDLYRNHSNDLQNAHGLMMSRSLSFNLPKRVANVTHEDGAEAFEHSLGARTQRSAILYADSPTSVDNIITL